MRNIIFVIFVIAVILASGCKASVPKQELGKPCDSYEMPMTEFEILECECPEGYNKFRRLDGAYCTTHSKKPCKAHADCPPNENCISDDGEEWFCTGRFAGCYYYDPENPDIELCMD